MIPGGGRGFVAAIWLQGLQESTATVGFGGAQGMAPWAEVLRNAVTMRIVATSLDLATED